MNFKFCIIATTVHIVVASTAWVTLAMLKTNLFVIIDFQSIIKPTIVIIIFDRVIIHTILFKLLD